MILQIQFWNVHNLASSSPSGTHVDFLHATPHSSSIHCMNPRDSGNKTVIPYCCKWAWLNGAAAYNAGWQTGHGAASSLKLASWSPVLLASQTPKLFYASGALIFHTVSSHDSPFPQRKIAGMKKRTLCDRLVHCATEFRLQSEGEREEREIREGGRGWGWCTLGCLCVRLAVVNIIIPVKLRLGRNVRVWLVVSNDWWRDTRVSLIVMLVE